MMFSENCRASLNKMLIMILLGIFTVAEILYMPDEYRSALDAMHRVILNLFK